MARESEAKIKFSILDKEFRKGLQEITKETTTLKKEFKLQAEQMKHTSTETGKLEQNIKRLGMEKEQTRKKIELTEKQLAKAKEYLGENSEEARILSNRLLDLQISEQKIENAIQDNRNAIEKQTIAQRENREATDKQANATNNSREAIDKQTSAMQQSIPDAKKYRKSLAEIGQTAIDVGERIQNIGQGISSFGQSWSMKVTAPIVATGGAVFKLANDWESSWTGVEKVVDGTAVELEELEQGLRDMTKELPATHQEIAEVAASAGQLGIATGDIKEFTRVMLDLGESTNLTADEAATNLARFANITGMTADNYDRLGSTIVGLGNNLATTEKEIVEMAMRLAGAGAQIGMSEAQILSFAASLSSVGIEAEAGGSAFSKVMANIQLAAEAGGKDLQAYAKVAGMSASEFKKAFQEDAAGAILAFIEGLSTAENRGLSAIGILDEMGLSEIRLRDALLRASGASDLFSDSIELGSKAWEENIALTEEAEKRYATNQSEIKMMMNRIKDTAITLGESLAPAIMDALDAAEPFIEKIEEGAEAFSQMDEEQQRSILKMIALVAAVGPASIALGGLTTGIGGVVKFGGTLFSLLGRVGGKGLLARIGGLGVSGPVGLAIAGVTGMSLATKYLISDTRDLYDASFEKVRQMQEEINATDDLIARFEEMQRQNRLTTDEMLEYMDILDQLSSTSSPNKIKELKDRQAELLEKSEFTNEEMEEFLGLNDKIIEQAPNTAQAISEQGNAYADNLQALKDLNAEKRNEMLMEAEQQILEGLRDERDLLAEQMELQREKNQAMQDFQSAHNEYIEKLTTVNELVGQRSDLETEMADLLDQGYSVESEKVQAIAQQIALLSDKQVVAEDELNTAKETRDTHQDTLETKEKELEKINEELQRLDDLKYEYEALWIAHLDLNAEKGKGIQAIDEEIGKQRDLLKYMEDKYDESQKNTQEYRDAKKEIENQITRLEEAKGELEQINKLAAETAYEKTINISTSPSIAKINRDIATDVYKRVTVGIDARYPQRLAYKDGTKFHPGGDALVAEEGPELIREGNKLSIAREIGIYNLRRGAQVFTAEQTMKMLSLPKRLPAYAGGVGVPNDLARNLDLLSSNLVNSKQNNTNISIDVGVGDVIIDGHTVGRIVWKPVKEHIDRDAKDKKDFKG